MGNPKPSIKWTRDGVAVESGAHFQVKTEDRHALLTILDCSKTDSGPYMITADNSLGSDFATINVQVSDRPDPPRFPTFSQVGTDSLVLEWQNPSWDGGSAITNYLIEKQVRPFSFRIQLKPALILVESPLQELPMTAWTRAGHTRFNLFPVTGLTPGNEYKFRVFAENVHGRSDASDESSTVQTKGVAAKKQPRTKYEGRTARECSKKLAPPVQSVFSNFRIPFQSMRRERRSAVKSAR